MAMMACLMVGMWMRRWWIVMRMGQLGMRAARWRTGLQVVRMCVG